MFLGCLTWSNTFYKYFYIDMFIMILPALFLFAISLEIYTDP